MVIDRGTYGRRTAPTGLHLARPDQPFGVREEVKGKAKLEAKGYLARPELLRSVSADRIVDKDETKAYYRARIEVNRNELDELGNDVKLVPGMPADVIIVTGNRTMVRYQLDPILNAMWKTFREA